jgi:hypothetical protein
MKFDEPVEGMQVRMPNPQLHTSCNIYVAGIQNLNKLYYMAQSILQNCSKLRPYLDAVHFRAV